MLASSVCYFWQTAVGYKLMFIPFPLLDTSLGKVNFLFFIVQSTIQMDKKCIWKAIQSGIQFIIKYLKNGQYKSWYFESLTTKHELSLVVLKHTVAWSQDPLCLTFKGSPEQCNKKEFFIQVSKNVKLWTLSLAHTCGIGRAGDILCLIAIRGSGPPATEYSARTSCVCVCIVNNETYGE